MATNNLISPYFVALQNAPTSIVKVKKILSPMAINNIDNSLLYCSEDSFTLIDEQQNRILNIQREFKVSGMCFSSFLKQFLILGFKPDYTLYSLDSSTHELTQVKKFSRAMWSCACYDKTFIISEGDNGSRIEVYDLCADDWNPVKKFTAPLSCEADHQIEKIRFNSDGSRLGVILRQGSQYNYHYWFELRNSSDMTVILKSKIGPNSDDWCWLLALPNQEFLATLWRQKKLFLFDLNGQLKETTKYDKNVKYLNSIALVNDKCLVVQTWQPDEICFYNFQT